MAISQCILFVQDQDQVKFLFHGVRGVGGGGVLQAGKVHATISIRTDSPGGRGRHVNGPLPWAMGDVQ